uniref:Uncharacterized protein n=1 Tax=Kuenenia stuttgartiensis TaxID=174633 RepID=Q1Q043_KUEST|nr:unknown protein [Candidatus Kuenenia stuttgartiensis]
MHILSLQVLPAFSVGQNKVYSQGFPPVCSTKSRYFSLICCKVFSFLKPNLI